MRQRSEGVDHARVCACAVLDESGYYNDKHEGGDESGRGHAVSTSSSQRMAIIGALQGQVDACKASVSHSLCLVQIQSQPPLHAAAKC